MLHRIYKVDGDDYYFVGDNQVDIEGPIKRDQIFAIVYKVKEKGKRLNLGIFGGISFIMCGLGLFLVVI